MNMDRIILGLFDLVKEEAKNIIGSFDILRKIIYLQQLLVQGHGCNLPFMSFSTWKVFENKFGGLASIV